MKSIARALLVSILAALSLSAAATPTPDATTTTATTLGLLVARDVCGAGYPGFCRRTNSPCKASNGDHEFCACDRTNIVTCVNGKWTDGEDCQAGGTQCTAREDGAKAVCL